MVECWLDAGNSIFSSAPKRAGASAKEETSRQKGRRRRLEEDKVIIKWNETMSRRMADSLKRDGKIGGVKSERATR
jgi:hypothetical protein